MNFSKLETFITESAESDNPALRKVASEVLNAMIANQEQEDVVDSDADLKDDSRGTKQPQDQVDALLVPAFPELAQPEEDKSTFGKISSAYSSDIDISSLPKETTSVIYSFVPGAKDSDAQAVLYGMVVDEILPKVDKHNFEVAEAHVKKELASKGKKALGDKFQDKLKTKYILVLNDKVIDGHHFIALAKILHITCSLRVLDLTPVRFQLHKTSSLMQAITNHEQSNYSRKSGAPVSLYARVSSVLRR